MEWVCQGKIDVVLGCDEEICQCIDIFICRRQNNLIFIGEVGVGKIVVVEGFVLWIVLGDVFELLKNVEVYMLDLGLL